MMKLSKHKTYAILSILLASLFVIIAMLVNVSIKSLDKPNVQTNKVHKIKKVKETKTKYDGKRRLLISKMVMYNGASGFKKQGMVSIPSVNILLPIYNDAYSDKGLSYGAAYANRSKIDPKGTSVPMFGHGNYGLAAHNFNDGKTGFSSLQEKMNSNMPYLRDNEQLGGSSWLNGQNVYLANGSSIFVYQITGQRTVSSKDTSVLNKSNKTKLTIISCLFPNTNYRIVTSAELVKTVSWADASDTEISLFDLQHQNTNAHVSWFNPGPEEGANGVAGGTK